MFMTDDKNLAGVDFIELIARMVRKATEGSFTHTDILEVESNTTITIMIGPTMHLSDYLNSLSKEKH